MRYLSVRKVVQFIRAYARPFMFWRSSPVRKFIIFGQGRTGSTLLVDLLNSSPEIHCDGEILIERVQFPKLFIAGRSRLSGRSTYGFKVKIYQLTDVQGIKNPRQFMVNMHKRGWKIIYLRRTNILRQALSNIVAIHRKSFHRRQTEGPFQPERIYVDCDDLLNRMRKRASHSRDEAGVLKDLPHVTVTYENELLKAESHQESLDRVFEYVGVPSVPVRTKLVRTTSDSLSDIIQNFEEVSRFIGHTEYAGLLSEQ